MSDFIVKWRRRRGDVKKRQLELNAFPVTPLGFADGQFPASALIRSDRWSFKFKQQKIELNEYPFSATTSNAIYAGPANDYVVEWKRPRKTQQALTQPSYPVAAITTDLSYHPGSNLLTPFRHKVKYRLQTTLNADYFEPAIAYEYTVSSVWSVDETSKPKRRKRQSPPDVVTVPEASPAYYSGYYPGSTLAKSFRFESKRKLQTVELDEYPATPAPTDVGEYPASRRLDALIISFKRTHLQSGLDEYPETPAPTDAGGYPGFSYKTFGVEKARKTGFRRVVQPEPELSIYPFIVVVPTGPGLEYTLPEHRLHFTLSGE